MATLYADREYHSSTTGLQQVELRKKYPIKVKQHLVQSNT
jgi:hypothetical protein